MDTQLPKIPVLDLTPETEALWPQLNEAIQRVIRSGQFIMGPDVGLFESEVAAYLGVKHAIAVNSGTDALVIGLRALGIGPEDEVITTPFTFFATAESISAVGAKPVFVDIDAATFNIDPSKIEAAITPKTKAILPVHLYGSPCAMDEILAIAHKYQLKVVEDCAQSFGARYNGIPTGTIGDVGAFSFFPSKNLGAFGDGGLVVTNNDAVAQQAKMLRVHGAKKKYHNEVLGYNSRLDTLQAAILRVKLPLIASKNAGRYEAAKRYNQLLDHPRIITPELVEGHVFHQYTLRVLSVDRDHLQKYLEDRGIGTMVYYPIPQDRLPIYNGQYPPNPVSDLLTTQVISLPIWPEISENVQKRIAEAIFSFLPS